MYLVGGGVFYKWYFKRFIRIYIPVWLITIFYLLIGSYNLSSDRNIFWWLIYPTYYHFVASIILLYIPFYFCMRTECIKKHLGTLMLGIFMIAIVLYISLYDKSYYHIDTVREPMIRFLFFESMLLGAWFRHNDINYRNKPILVPATLSCIFFIIYFASKILFSRNSSYSDFQIINQVILFILLYFIFRLFAGLDGRIEQLPVGLKKIIGFIANLTLEVYLVQYVLIEYIRPLFGFPLNWIALTTTIILVAYILHLICRPVLTFLSRQFD